jgi:hypothetical protein
MLNAWTALMSGLSLLVGITLGGLLHAWWLRRKASGRLRPPARWPLRKRRLVNDNEAQVWNWLRSSFHDHVVMVKVPVLRFTKLLDSKKANGADSSKAKADTLIEGERWLELLNGIYTSFTVCTTDGKVVGCVDVSDKPPLAKGSHELKETLLSDCGIAYTVVSASTLPEASAMRALFLGEVKVDCVEHQVTRGGDSNFHADLITFAKQQGQAAN